MRRLRDQTPLEEIAARGGLDLDLLQNVEAGRKPVDEFLARQILADGFGLEAPDIDRLIVGVRLYDLGLRDNAIRPLIADVILKTVPATVRRELQEIYRRYTSLER